MTKDSILKIAVSMVKNKEREEAIRYLTENLKTSVNSAEELIRDIERNLR